MHRLDDAAPNLYGFPGAALISAIRAPFMIWESLTA
jgi:hypothetical protein